MRRITVLLLVLCLIFQATGCAKVNSGSPEKNITGQKEIARINRYDSVIPKIINGLIIRKRRFYTTISYLTRMRWVLTCP